MNRIGAEDITLEDCIKRANSVSGSDWHSGISCSNKDVRRIIYLTNTVEKLQDELNKQATVIMLLKK